MTKDEIESIILDGDPQETGKAVLSAALYSGDATWAQAICFSLAEHSSPQVRGNVFTAIGHIARLHGTMDWDRATKVLTAGLMDTDEFARGNAIDGLDDVTHFRKFTA